ncbi:MAG: acyltransferase [Labilithrix sp.]|nr:acyltransferase [Labilithrix sp.]
MSLSTGGTSGPEAARAVAPRPPGPGIAHVPALDGIRGLAVLAVVAFHADAALAGGYLGVDLFFVLSGYLITSILLREVEASGRVDLRAFWARRARRLLPALLVLMPAIAVYARVWAAPGELAGLRADALATLGYVANWRAIYAGKSYWEIFQAPSPLEHTWSLAIEEQFYVAWPLVVALVLVRLGRTRRTLLVVSAGLALVSAARMILLWDPERTSRVYMGSDTRAAAILAGVVLATVLAPGTRLRPGAVRALDAAGLLAAAGLGVAWAKLDGESRFLYHGGFWLTEVAALALIACAVVPTSLVARALSLRPLVFVGTISYGVYLWHWPVDVVLTPERVHAPPLALAALRIAVTFAIALASYHAIERPIRARGVFFGRPIVVVPAAFGVALAAVLAGTRARPAPPVASLAPAPAPSTSEARRWPDFNSVKSSALPPASELPPGTLRILTIGDSVAQYLGEAMRFQQAAAGAFVAQRGVGACSIHVAEVRYVNGERIEGTCCADAWQTDVAELRPDVTLIVLGGAYLGPRTCKRDWRKAYRERLTSLLHAMGSDAGRVILTLVPYPGQRWRTADMVQRVDCFNEELTQIAEIEHLSTLDLKTHVCPTTDCDLLSNGAAIRPDGLHFDGPGAVETARWTLAEVRRIALGPGHRD